MNFSGNLLSLLIFLPLVGAIALYALPFGLQKDTNARAFSLLVSLTVFVLSLFLLEGFDPLAAGYQFQTTLPWIPTYGISYFVGVDGISIYLILLTTFLTPLVILASSSVQHKLRAYLACMLALETAMLGALVALDVFLFYVFWELMLAPMYFIIGIWGGKRRIYATLKFVLYTVLGSLLMLVGIIYVVWLYYEQQQVLTFSLPQLLANLKLTFFEELWIFGLFALAFGIKVPIFPFHTWLPDAHVEAPTGGSVILAGVLLKMGLYGFLRFAYPLFPNAAFVYAELLAVLAVVGIVYGSLVAWAQTDIKKLIAYSSVAHLGFCVLGLAAFNTIALSGSILQMINHGISTGALFLIVGVLYDRKHTRLIADYGGLASKVPMFASLFLIVTLSSIALPLTNGFIGEFLILNGSFKPYPVLTVVALSGVVLGAVYMLTLYLRCMFGKLDQEKNGDLSDLNRVEIMTFLPLVIMVFVIGIYPQPILRAIVPAADTFIEQVEARKKMLATQITRSSDTQALLASNLQK